MLCLGLFLRDTGLGEDEHTAPLAGGSLWGLVATNVQTSHLKNQQNHLSLRIHPHHCMCFYMKGLRKSPCLDHIKQP